MQANYSRRRRRHLPLSHLYVILSLMFHHSPLPFTIYDDDDGIIIFTVMSSPRWKSNSFTFVGAEEPENFLGHFAVINFLVENLNGLQICSP